MNLIFPINFVGHAGWMKSGYAHNLAKGDVLHVMAKFLANGEQQATIQKRIIRADNMSLSSRGNSK